VSCHISMLLVRHISPLGRSASPVRGRYTISSLPSTSKPHDANHASGVATPTWGRHITLRRISSPDEQHSDKRNTSSFISTSLTDISLFPPFCYAKPPTCRIRRHSRRLRESCVGVSFVSCANIPSLGPLLAHIKRWRRDPNLWGYRKTTRTSVREAGVKTMCRSATSFFVSFFFRTEFLLCIVSRASTPG
jgi:hypothetical protein